MTGQESSGVLPRELRWFRALTAILTGAIWAAVGITRILHLRAAWVWPLAPHGYTFFDFSDYQARFERLHQIDFLTMPGYPFTYFAPGVPLYEAFYAFGPWGGLVAYFAVIAAALVASFVLMRRAMLRYGFQSIQIDIFLLIAICTSYPVLFAIERGNLEIVLAIGMAVGIWAYWKGHTWTAAVVWGIFGSVKLYPLIFLALFLSRRQYRQFLFAIITAAATTLLSLMYIGPTISVAATGIRNGIHAFLRIYTLNIVNKAFDHSVFMILKLATRRFNPDLNWMLSGYLTALTSLMLVLYFIRIRKLPLANQLLILTVSSITLPPTSFDYTLVQLYAPWAVLVFLALRAAREGGRIPGLLPSFSLLALAFTPANFVYFNGSTYGAEVKCLVLLSLLLLALLRPFEMLLIDSGETGLVSAE